MYIREPNNVTPRANAQKNKLGRRLNVCSNARRIRGVGRLLDVGVLYSLKPFNVSSRGRDSRLMRSFSAVSIADVRPCNPE